MPGRDLCPYAGAAMWRLSQKVANIVPTALLLFCCLLCVLVECGSAQLSASEIQMLFTHSLQNGMLDTDSPEFKTSLLRRKDSRKHSHREYLVFNGYGDPARYSGSPKDVCIIKEDWHFKRQDLVEINQFIICQPPHNTVSSFKSHKFITENSGGTVLRMVWTKFSDKDAYAVLREVADQFLAEIDAINPSQSDPGE